MEILIWIVFIIIGLFVAKITWKFYPHFISRREKYVNSHYEIQKKRGVQTFAAFIVTLIVGYGVIKVMKERDLKEKGTTVSEQQISNQSENQKMKSQTEKTLSERENSEKGNDLIEDSTVSETELESDTTLTIEQL